MDHGDFRELPPPNVDAEEYLNSVRLADEEDARKRGPMGAGVGGAISEAMSDIPLRRGKSKDETGPETIEPQATSEQSPAEVIKDENFGAVRETVEGAGARSATGKVGSIFTRKKHQPKDAADSDAPTEEHNQEANQ